MLKTVKQQIVNALTWFYDNLRNQVVNNLTSTSTDQPLSAYQGKVLNERITAQESNFVHKSGDTMTGNLTIQRDTPLLKLISTSGGTNEFNLQNRRSSDQNYFEVANASQPLLRVNYTSGNVYASTGNYFTSNAHGYYATTASGASQSLLMTSGNNLYLGSVGTSQHIAGQVFISSGYNSSANAGYETFKVSVANSGNASCMNYDVWHSGNFPKNHAVTNSTYGLANATRYGHVKIDNDFAATSYEDGVVASAYEVALLNTQVVQTDAKFRYLYKLVPCEYTSEAINPGTQFDVSVPFTVPTGYYAVGVGTYYVTRIQFFVNNMMFNAAHNSLDLQVTNMSNEAKDVKFKAYILCLRTS